MKTSERPDLKQPVLALKRKLREGDETIPMTDIAALFGAGEEVLDRVRPRGDLRLKGDVFTNDGPDLLVRAGRVELEIPSLMRGHWSVDETGFVLRFPSVDFTVRACVVVAIVRKCFDLNEIRATDHGITLDFGSVVADRRYTF